MASGEPVAGSSPLARGTLSGLQRIAPAQGLIPARAGNTMPGGILGGGYRAHPRSRGEHCGVAAPEEGPEGSSPLARGTQGPAVL